jgi:hypothetical protein
MLDRLAQLLFLAWDGARVGALVVIVLMGADILAMVVTSWRGFHERMIIGVGLPFGVAVAVLWGFANRNAKPS